MTPVAVDLYARLIQRATDLRDISTTASTRPARLRIASTGTLGQWSDFRGLVIAEERALRTHVARTYPDLETDVLVNQVLEIAWRKFDDVPRDRPDLWLRQVARNVAANMRRGRRRWLGLISRASESAPRTTQPVDHDARLQSKVVAIALGRLSSEDRDLLRIQAADEPSSEELGVILGVSAETARTRLHRARRRLNEACEDIARSESA